jgi:hypothetical protein
MVTTNHSLPSDTDFSRLEGELFSRIERQHRGQVFRHRLVAVAAAVAIAGASIAAGTIASPSQETKFAYCFASASTASQSQTTILSVKSGLDGTNGSLKPSAAKVRRAVTQCDGLWSAGVFGAASVGKTPKLQPCLRDDLVIAVFPRKGSNGTAEKFCENLGMSAP